MRLKIYYKRNTNENKLGIIVEPDGTKHIPDYTVPIGDNISNWEFMKKYVDKDIEFYVNGILKEITILEKVGQDENDIWFFELTFNISGHY